MVNKPKATRPSDITADAWIQVGTWIADSARDMEIDAKEIEESNPGLMPALRGLSDYLLRGGALSEGRPSAADIVTMLRNRAEMSPGQGAYALRSAADEIERMSKALASKRGSPSTPRTRKPRT